MVPSRFICASCRSYARLAIDRAYKRAAPTTLPTAIAIESSTTTIGARSYATTTTTTTTSNNALSRRNLNMDVNGGAHDNRRGFAVYSPLSSPSSPPPPSQLPHNDNNDLDNPGAKTGEKTSPSPNANGKASKAKRKGSKSPAAKLSLRRVAVEAQRSAYQSRNRENLADEITAHSKTVTAYTVAERFDLGKVVAIARANGFEPDPFNTQLYPQVVHIQVPVASLRRTMGLPPASQHPHPHPEEREKEIGDVFVFPSGTVVAWSLPDTFTLHIAQKMLAPASLNPHLETYETEDLDFVEDPNKDYSTVRGDTIVLGTKESSESLYYHQHQQPAEVDDDAPDAVSLGNDDSSSSSAATTTVSDSDSDNGTTTTTTTTNIEKPGVDIVLTKIAFSSGLARSTKLAVLESLLDRYIDGTRHIATLLSTDTRLPFTRRFILRKTGEVLSVRAQLNLYSELTDSLPDLFWDSRYDLGLEGYYDQVGKALDVGIRIKLLNERMDYAQEIASVLRERLSETHGLRLEWIVILLIAVEVGFEVLRLCKERKQETSDVASAKKE